MSISPLFLLREKHVRPELVEGQFSANAHRFEIVSKVATIAVIVGIH